MADADMKMIKTRNYIFWFFLSLTREIMYAIYTRIKMIIVNYFLVLDFVL